MLKLHQLLRRNMIEPIFCTSFRQITNDDEPFYISPPTCSSHNQYSPYVDEYFSTCNSCINNFLLLANINYLQGSSLWWCVIRSLPQLSLELFPPMMCYSIITQIPKMIIKKTNDQCGNIIGYLNNVEQIWVAIYDGPGWQRFFGVNINLYS